MECVTGTYNKHVDRQRYRQRLSSVHWPYNTSRGVPDAEGAKKDSDRVQSLVLLLFNTMDMG
jgi:hypothetical protein